MERMCRAPSLIGGQSSQQRNGFQTPRLNELQVITKSNHGTTLGNPNCNIHRSTIANPCCASSIGSSFSSFNDLCRCQFSNFDSFSSTLFHPYILSMKNVKNQLELTSLPRHATMICLMIHGVELIMNAKDMVATDRVTASSTFTFFAMDKKEESH